MTVARFAISLDEDLARAVRKAAGKQATSAWIADAARRKLRAEGLLQVVRDWEAEHGEITPDELRRVEEPIQSNRSERRRRVKRSKKGR
jgi:hypothetical protein